MAISFTLTEWVIVGLVLLFGWVLGLLSSGAGKKWKARYEQERQAHADSRAAHAEALQAEQNRLRTLETRNRELERTHTATPAATAAAATAAATTPAAASHTTAGDDLSRIRGIGADGRDRLAEDGITGYRDVETLDGDRAADIERRYGMAPGTIDREDWRGQARTLREQREAR